MFLKRELCSRPNAANRLGASSTFLWSEQTWKLFPSTPSRSRSLVPLGAVSERAVIRRRSIWETVLRMLLLGLRASQFSKGAGFCPDGYRALHKLRGRILLFLFLHLSSFRFRLLDNLFLQLRRHDVVMMHFHVEAAPPLGHRSEIRAIS